MTARKKEGFPVNPFLKVPTLIVTNTLRPPGKLALTSAQAGRSFPAPICSPHSLSCQTTPAFGPITSLNQLAKGRLGSGHLLIGRDHVFVERTRLTGQRERRGEK